ncbi:MAG: hypothetical protein ACRD96_22460 [Bryobacteraceae bacterium]
MSASFGGQPNSAWTKMDGAGLNFVAYHDPRESYDAPETTTTVEAFPWWFMTPFRLTGYHAQPFNYFGWREPQLTNDTLPIHFGEPERHRYLHTQTGREEDCDQN